MVTKGERLGRYLVLEALGAGGMAEVILAARQGAEGFEKRVVLKRIHPLLAHDPTAERMFVEEARIASRFEHPNVVRVEDLERDSSGRLVLAMEHVEGASLDALVAREREPLVPWLAAFVVAELLGALDYLHHLRDETGAALRVVHRDVNPPNILLSRLGRVKLADFGIASYAGKSKTTQVGQLKGKLAYMSPEQIQGRPVGPRADLFSAGVVLWELLAGRSLFGELDDLSAMVAICEEGRIAPSLERPAVPPELDQIALAALAVDPEDRPLSAGSFRVALLGAARESCGAELPDAGYAALAARFEPRSDEHDTLDFAPPRGPTLDGAETLTVRGPERVDAPAAEGPLFEVCVGDAAGRALPLDEALGAMRRELERGRRPTLGLPEGPSFSEDEVERLLDVALGPGRASAPGLTEVGRLDRDPLDVLWRLERRRASGTLAVAHPSGAWVEVTASEGRLVAVRTSLPQLQMPRRLAAVRGWSGRELGEAVRAALAERTPLEAAEEAAGRPPVRRSDLARDRLAVLLDWDGADIAFVPGAPAAAPIAPGLIAPFPTLFVRAWPASRLEASLGEALGRPHRTTPSFPELVPRLELDRDLRRALDALTRDRPLGETLDQLGELRTTGLALAWVLLRCRALVSRG